MALLMLLLLAAIHFFLEKRGMPSASARRDAYGEVYVPLNPSCSNSSNYTNASPYQRNPVDVLHALPPGASQNRGFNTSAVGEAPDTFFGLIMCYADRNWTECNTCLEAAAAGIVQTCPFSRRSKACYDACILRYSNESFFSIADLTIAFHVISPDSFVDDMDTMHGTRLNLTTRLTAEAGGSSLRLANGSEQYTDSQGGSHVMHGLAQCTRDLNASECTRCLSSFVAEMPRLTPNYTYGAVKGYNCYVAYKVDFDLRITIPPTPLPSGTPVN